MLTMKAWVETVSVKNQVLSSVTQVSNPSDRGLRAAVCPPPCC